MNLLKNVLGFRGVAVLYILGSMMYVDFVQYIIPTSELTTNWQLSDWLKHGRWGIHCFHAIDAYVQYMIISNAYNKLIDYPFLLLQLHLKTAIPLWISLVITTSLPNFVSANFVGEPTFAQFFLIPRTGSSDKYTNYVYHYYTTNFVANFILLNIIAAHRFLETQYNKKVSLPLLFALTFGIGLFIDIYRTFIIFYSQKNLEDLEFYYYYTGFDIPAYMIGAFLSYFLNRYHINQKTHKYAVSIEPQQTKFGNMLV